jgi:hypothetical protein
LENAERHVAATGDVPFLTEYGATDDLDTIERLVRLSDAHMVSWQYWHYCDCADPTTSGPGVQALVIDPELDKAEEYIELAKFFSSELLYAIDTHTHADHNSACKVLREKLQQDGGDAPHETALFAMTANRLARPASKLACYEHWLADEVYWPEAKALALEHLYRALDFLLRHIASLEQELFFRTADLFNADVDLIFWDTTTLYCEIDDEDVAGATGVGQELVDRDLGGHVPVGVVGELEALVLALCDTQP